MIAKSQNELIEDFFYSLDDIKNYSFKGLINDLISLVEEVVNGNEGAKLNFKATLQALRIQLTSFANLNDLFKSQFHINREAAEKAQRDFEGKSGLPPEEIKQIQASIKDFMQDPKWPNLKKWACSQSGDIGELMKLIVASLVASNSLNNSLTAANKIAVIVGELTDIENILTNLSKDSAIVLKKQLKATLTDWQYLLDSVNIIETEKAIMTDCDCYNDTDADAKAPVNLLLNAIIQYDDPFKQTLRLLIALFGEGTSSAFDHFKIVLMELAASISLMNRFVEFVVFEDPTTVIKDIFSQISELRVDIDVLDKHPNNPFIVEFIIKKLAEDWQKLVKLAKS